MMKKMLYFSCLCLFGFAASGVARADTIGPNCGSCLGSSYTLTYEATSNPDVFDVFLVVNTTGFTNSSSDLLNAVSLKLVPQSSDITSVSLLSQPASFGSTVFSGLSANGCSGSSGGFFCSRSTGNGVAVGGVGDIYSFEWALTAGAPGDLATGLDDASIKALYVGPTGKQNGITSEDITLTQAPGVTPEPSSLLLLGTGIIGLAGVARKRISA